MTDGLQSLLNAYDLFDTFQPVCLLGDDPKSRKLAKEALRKAAPVFWELPVSEQGLAELDEHLNDWSGEGRPVAWLELRDYNDASWGQILPRLNFHRDAFENRAPLFLVMAGPRALEQPLRDCAGDLRSVAFLVVLEDQPGVSVARETLRWLHLSDFHFKEHQGWRARFPLRALLNKLKGLVDEGLAPHCVLLTGDMANSGLPREYEEALAFCRKLGDVLGLNPAEHFFMVPGNHDVDRRRVTTMAQILVNSIKGRAGLRELMADTDSITAIGRRMEAYYAFTRDLLGGGRASRPDQPSRADTLTAAGWQVGIMQLNLAWAGGTAGEKGRLYLGEDLLLEMRELLAGTDLRLGLCHQPLSYLADFEEGRIGELLAEEAGVHLLLRGHLHQNDAARLSTVGGEGFLTVAAGATLTNDTNYQGFCLGELAPNGAGRLRFYAYSDRGSGFWTEDTRFHKEAVHGVWPFALELGEATVARGPDRQRRELLEQRYREAAHGYFSMVHFFGIAANTPTRTAQVGTLFVPPRLGHGDEDLLTATLPERFVGGEAPFRAVVLGDPGSGKSTLCRYLVARLGEGDGPLPLLLPFREYMIRQDTEGLLDYLYRQAKTALGTVLPEGFLEPILARGGAVLLLDGLDEVGDPRRRTEMRDRVLAFCAAWPKLPVLVTSRFGGYEDAPLPDPFVRLELRAFSDAELNDFVFRWYEVQDLPADTRREKVAGLVAALARAPRARELARNPLLATLLALVHYHRVKLPGQRALLYQLVVDTLLDSWPAGRNRDFRQTLSVDQQRVYLAELAWWFQQVRRGAQTVAAGAVIEEEGSGNVLVARENLQAQLETLLAAHLGGEQRALAEKWLLHLERETGLLLEQQTGYFGFFHLSLMEFLAACHLMRNLKQPEMILARQVPEWGQVRLLAVGLETENLVLLAMLVEAARAGKCSWYFLLQCAREEAGFKAAELREICESLLDGALDTFPWTLKEYAEQLDDLVRFSRKHQEVARAWRREKIDETDGDRLPSVYAFFWDDSWAKAAWENREDQATLALARLRAAPVGPWTKEAAPKIGWEDAQGFVLNDLPEELMSTFGFELMGASAGPIHAAMVIRCLFSGADEQRLLRGTLVRHREKYGQAPAVVRSGAFSLLLERDLICPAEKFISSNPAARDFARYLARDFARAKARDFARYLAQAFARDFARYLAQAFARNLAQAFARNFDEEKIAATLSGLTYEQNGVPTSPIIRAPFTWKVEIAVHAYLSGVLAQHLKKDDRETLLYARLGAVALQSSWSDLDRAMPAKPHPYQQALYLALGTCSTMVTCHWPDSTRWQAVLAEQPQHWLPRFVWHLAQMLAEPGACPAHHQAMAAVLSEGDGDLDLPGCAAALRRFHACVNPTPPT